MTQIKQLAKGIFRYEARLVLRKYKPKIIAITGSVGKTTTRDFLYGILSKKFFVRKSEKSFTTGLGIPLSILGCSNGKGTLLDWLKNIFAGLSLLLKRKDYPDWLILEIDADKPGDVDSIRGWLSVDVLVVTAIGAVPSHIEAFGSDIEKFLAEKKKLLDSVSRDGTVVYNDDDQSTSELASGSPLRKISCGLSADCDVRGSDFEILTSSAGNLSKPTGMRFEISSGAEKATVTIMDSVGIHNEYAVLLSVAVSNLLGLSLSESAKSAEKLQLLPGRMKIISGIKDSTVIDDSYNSSPVAMRQAVEVLAKVSSSGRKIAVVGDMLELGRYSTEEHREVGRELSEVVQHVICVGLRVRHVAEALLSLSYDENNISSFDTASEAGKFLQDLIQPGDIILVKGSQAMRMEKVVEEIMRHPEDKTELLVRQEPEWLSRD